MIYVRVCVCESTMSVKVSIYVVSVNSVESASQSDILSFDLIIIIRPNITALSY